jgi:CheY-like chemotaxis protein
MPGVMSMARVLIVDDEDVLIDMVAGLVEDLGHEPITAVNGKAALALLSGESSLPALIISDVMMPQMNGVELAQQVKKNPQYQKIPIILMSAAGEPKNSLNADHFINKPFNIDDLARLIEHCIGNRR